MTNEEQAMQWLVYIIQADDGSLYTGITKDIQRRWSEHCSMSVSGVKGGKGTKGAKFFRSRKPDQLVFLRTGFTRSSATQYELAVKKLKRAAKLKLIKSDANHGVGELDWMG